MTPQSPSLRADDASPGGGSPARARPPSQERRLILSACLGHGDMGEGNCVLSNGQTWGFSHTVIYVDTCTKDLQPPEPHRSFPKRKFLMYPQPKAFMDGLNNHPARARVPVS